MNFKRFSVIFVFLLSNISALYADLSLDTFYIGSFFQPDEGAQELSFNAPEFDMSLVSTLPVSVNSDVSFVVDHSVLLSDESVDSDVPTKLLNFPNPFSFRTGTEIGYQLNSAMDVQLRIYSLSGYLVFEKSFLSTQEGGLAKYNRITVSQATCDGTWFSPGVYIYMLIHEGRVLARNRMVVMP